MERKSGAYIGAAATMKAKCDSDSGNLNLGASDSVERERVSALRLPPNYWRPHANRRQTSLTIDIKTCENGLARTGSNFGTAALISGVTM
jgi:hypothetical protein